MIFHQVWRIMSIGLAELAVQERRERLLPFSHFQMLSLLEISLRSCKKPDKLYRLHWLPWLVLVVQVSEVLVATSAQEGEEVAVALATGL